MAQATFEISMRLEWEEFTPEDTRNCYVCDDPIFLNGGELIAYVGKSKTKNYIGVKVCQACRDAINLGE